MVIFVPRIPASFLLFRKLTLVIVSPFVPRWLVVVVIRRDKRVVMSRWWAGRGRVGGVVAWTAAIRSVGRVVGRVIVRWEVAHADVVGSAHNIGGVRWIEDLTEVAECKHSEETGEHCKKHVRRVRGKHG